MKSVGDDAFYHSVPSSQPGRESFHSTPATAGPWTEKAQHGGPPAALLGRALERLDDGADRVLGRFTMDLLGPVPVGPLSIETTVLRPGRSVSLRQATLYDDTSGRAVARAQGWAFPVGTDGPAPPATPLPHTAADGHEEDPPPGWSRGYLDSMDWQWVEGAVTKPGPAIVWMRPRIPLLPGEEMTPWQRLLTCVDSASGASAELDPARWSFLNTDLTVHLVRPPEGEWVCLDAVTTLGPGAVGLAAATLYDERGPVGRSAQALLVVPARG